MFLRGVEQACGWWICLEAPGKGGGGSADTGLLALPSGTGEEDCRYRNATSN